MERDERLLTLTAEIATAHVSRADVPIERVGELISGIYGALAAAGQPAASPEPARVPAVDPKKSVKREAITSLIDGKPYKMLKRHIGLHGFTPESYREAFGLARDYPMVAPDYAARRALIAKENGLGRRPGGAAAG